MAEILGVGRSSVFDRHAKYRERGLAALSRSSLRAVLSDRQMMRLRAMIVGADPRQHSFGVRVVE